jgi:ABC-type multidrug transport system fused ATPase/permease subunit
MVSIQRNKIGYLLSIVFMSSLKENAFLGQNNYYFSSQTYLLQFSTFNDFLEVSCWTITGQRQAARIRALYLKAILRQDIAFFDMEMSTGQVVERMSADTLLVQDAIGEKVCYFEIMEEL